MTNEELSDYRERSIAACDEEIKFIQDTYDKTNEFRIYMMEFDRKTGKSYEFHFKLLELADMLSDIKELINAELEDAKEWKQETIEYLNEESD